MKNNNLSTFFYYFGIIYFLELAFKFLLLDKVLNLDLIYLILFTLPIAIFLTVITRLFKDKYNKILTWIITILLVIIFEGQFIFINLFSIPFSFRTINLMNQALDFIEIIPGVVWTYLGGFLLLLTPILILIALRKRLYYEKFEISKTLILIGSTIVMYITSLLLLLPFKTPLYSAYNLYYKVDAYSQIIEKFGLVTGMRLDIKRIMFGLEESIVTETPNTSIDDKKDDIIYGQNITDINFNDLIANEKNATIKEMHEYFSNQTATNKNKYTGLFKDKNLIFIIAEAYNQILVNEETKSLFPTLYNLTHQGFVFENYYTPVILSTVGGEMQALLGLIPFQETIQLWPKNKAYFPYAIGNSFSAVGYFAKAYHNHTYSYYDRNKTRSTIGFSDYLGCGNGLQKIMKCGIWPESDYEMAKAIGKYFIGTDNKQLTYILTVSGHANYKWTGNNMSKKHKSEVEHLPYSEEVKGYIAANLELELMLSELIAQLEATGELANTVIAMVGDHYPYGFDLSQINELSTYERDKTFEVNRSDFVIWNSKMDTIRIKKVGSQIDVLPTLLNLFDIEYDSRIIIGNDILSDETGLAMFSNRSWISDYGKYDAGTGEFNINSGLTVPDNYIEIMNTIVANKFTMSKLIIQNDYYRKIFK